tara:strand:- start:335 stop:568 length:234 start_codon:yes stop_codon:yes gene_type:complete
VLVAARFWRRETWLQRLRRNWTKGSVSSMQAMHQLHNKVKTGGYPTHWLFERGSGGGDDRGSGDEDEEDDDEEEDDR